MTRLAAALAVLMTLFPAAGRCGDPDAIAAIVDAYRQEASFVEKLEYTIHLPDGSQESRAIESGRSGTGAFVTLGLPGGGTGLHVVTDESRVYASQFNVPNAYVDGPRRSTLGETLGAVGALQVGLTVPPSLAASEGAEAFRDALRFGLLEPLTLVGEVRSDSGWAVDFAAANGSCRLSTTGEGHLKAIELSVGEGSQTVRFEGRFTRGTLAEDDERLRFDAGERRAVASFAEMEAATYPLGTPAPDVIIPTLDGNRVALAELRGSVVILDFWATWCVPCWSALEHIEELAAWARDSGLPIAVWAVDTQEQTTDLAEQIALARGFLESRGLEVQSLVDVDDSFFGALHSPGLPSTVIIAPDGTLSRYHSGVRDDMTDVLRAEALELLGAN